MTGCALLFAHIFETCTFLSMTLKNHYLDFDFFILTSVKNMLHLAIEEKYENTI